MVVVFILMLFVIACLAQAIWCSKIKSYDYWNKYLAKREAKEYFSGSDASNMLPRVQIERNKKLTIEQLTELLERYDALKKRPAQQYIERMKLATELEEQKMRKFCEIYKQEMSK